MSLSQSPLRTPQLAPMPSPLALARSRVLRQMAGCALPRSVFFTHGQRDHVRKRIALTFDDGPDGMTSLYLDALDRLGIPATFFFVGENVARDPGLAREAVDRGHHVGGHGWSHEPFSTMTRSRLGEELARMSAVVPHTRGRPLVRPPRGALSARSLMMLAASGYSTVLWSVDSDDCRTRDAREIAWRLAPARVVTGDIVLMHEMQPWTLGALPTIVGELRSREWELVTVRELMEDV